MNGHKETAWGSKEREHCLPGPHLFLAVLGLCGTDRQNSLCPGVWANLFSLLSKGLRVATGRHQPSGGGATTGATFSFSRAPPHPSDRLEREREPMEAEAGSPSPTQPPLSISSDPIRLGQAPIFVCGCQSSTVKINGNTPGWYAGHSASPTAHRTSMSSPDSFQMWSGRSPCGVPIFYSPASVNGHPGGF